jgi:hypothetical protein
MVNDLALISDARNALERARTLDDVKAILDLAVAAKKYAEARRLGADTIRYAQEIVLRASRRMGQILIITQLNQGGRPALSKKPPTDVEMTVTLKDLAITKAASSRSQMMARIPDEVFEDFITHRPIISQKALLLLCRGYERNDSLIRPADEVIVYEMWRTTGELLYVGLSERGFTRIMEHSARQWFREIGTIRITRFNSVVDARISEERIIRESHPKYNRQHNGPEVL